jgi:hypothetical protein
VVLVGPDGLHVEVIALDRGYGPRPWLKVTRGGLLVSRGYYRTVAELARVVDLATLKEA